MTQRHLADLSTVSVRAIRDLELDQTRSPRRETVRLLADALRLTGPRRAALEQAAVSTGEWLAGDLVPPPAPLSPLLGRERDVSSLVTLLESSGHRMITAVGVAGVGKTRLGQEVAVQLHLRGRIPAVWLDHDERVPPAPHRASPDRLGAGLRVLLRGEPVLDELAHAVGDTRISLIVVGTNLDRTVQNRLRMLLLRCPGLRVLCESREAPAEPSSTVFPVLPLAVPEWQFGVAETDPARYPALQLLLSQYEQLRPDAAVDHEIATALAGICWYLDGIPTALESVAPWMLLYDPVRLLDMTRRDPLRLIAQRAETGTGLTEALRGTVCALEPWDAEVLRRLAAVRRPWTLEQALERIGDSLVTSVNRIYALCTRGLVRPVEPAGGGEQRFTVLNLVRCLLAADGVPALERHA
ncbi:hypothetical protein ACQP2P_32300 [Dactylosporangium sp. CA-139114]|uniref:hypothetical protein n=1 Tax=Dactylosporangium sp. CA-139114 TaxID=3239931 RepID=UPI003D951547